MQTNAARDVLEAQALLELARSLDPLERRILLSLRERGPGLAMEIAVRVYQFPDEIRRPLLNLRERQLIRSEEFTGSAFGDELISLSARGEQVATLLASGAVPSARQAEPPEAVAKSAGLQQPMSTAARWQREADLLQKLGELAAQQGDAKTASDYYRQALDALRKINPAPGA